MNNKFYNTIVTILESINAKDPIKKIFKKVKFYGIPLIIPEILRVIPHSLPAYTQGLYHDGEFLYESIGLHGQSSIRKIDTDSGKIVKSVCLENEFAEGITCINNKLVQLTWETGIAFIYKMPELEKIGQFTYKGEGWGITSKNIYYIMTNGSHYLYYRNQAFKQIKKKSVTINYLPLKKINDIVYVQSRIYANVLYENYIFEICEKTGFVTKVFDCSALRYMAKAESEEKVLNGIAYEKKTKTFFVTGKNWDYIFHVKLGINL